MLRLLVLASPSSATVFAGIASWLDHTLTGAFATGIAVIAVAWFGLSLLEGRIVVRRGALIMLGCFVLFGAPAMAKALLGFARQAGENSAVQIDPAQNASPPPLPPPSPPAYDPYAGASLPGH